MATKVGRAAEVLDRERREFEQRTPRSRERYERALTVLPGADTRAVTFYQPYPAVIRSSSRIELEDLDGNVYRDFLLNYTAMIVGHAHPEVVAVAQAAVARGTAVAAPVPGQLELAEELVRRVPSVERVRFVNSGSEATMTAVRVARALTGRPGVIKISGGYHGSYPDLDVTLRPGFQPAGLPESTPTRTVPYNDPDALEAALGGSAGECACVIMEPVLGAAGVVPGDRDYLVFAEEAARAAGALFVLDEVISYRLGPGGAQQLARSQARSHDVRQDHRGRLPGRRGRRPSRCHAGLRAGREPRLRPLRHVQRQPGHRRRRPQDARAARRGGVREARPPGRDARRRAACRRSRRPGRPRM